MHIDKLFITHNLTFFYADAVGLEEGRIKNEEEYEDFSENLIDNAAIVVQDFGPQDQSHFSSPLQIAPDGKLTVILNAVRVV